MKRRAQLALLIVVVAYFIGVLIAQQPPVVFTITQPTDVYKVTWDHDGKETDHYEVRFKQSDPWLPIGKPAPPHPVYAMPSLALGTYNVDVRACNDTECVSAMQPYSFTVAVPRPYGPLPGTWMSQDVGFVGQLGTASFSNGVYTLEGGGQDIYGEADGFRYVYQPMPDGDVTITAHVAAIKKTGDGWAKAGVMMRASLDPKAPHVLMTLLGNPPAPWDGVYAQLIFRDGKTPLGQALSVAADATKAKPSWVRLKRASNIVTGFYSVDGKTWFDGSRGAVAVPPGMAYIGLALSANTTQALNTATFDSVLVEQAGQKKLEDVPPAAPSDVKPINPTPLPDGRK